MKHYLMLLVPIVLLWSCHDSKQRNNEITKIEIATGSCFGPCQLTIVSIDKDLNYNYFGGETSFALPDGVVEKEKLRGYFTSKISRSYWDSLNVMLENINYKILDSSYQHSVDDQSLEILIHCSNKTKHIVAQSASLPDSVSDAFYSIIKSYKTVKPKPVKGSLKFELKVEGLAPMPATDHVQFLPPDKTD
ncbi:hypothetical protein D0C36_14640 [Mucilaginibacter conchicola]|uniref:DUF6438 domain-containing protein n=1 Tax=Mucilaginibacter conchicola TaxID=2303333 RepID=A0A372NVK6_9SPHI|nr:DUF6438 domain-containing protein [Mucilaginibacter conchicola]RFZ92647.1 hypothetical protein D0C36_14640 [Mucilaginibacter conchicola]